jgi:hypothetical protein
MASIVRKWEKIFAIGCSHGEYIDRKVAKAVIKAADDFGATIRFHLGDFIDTQCWRRGASGTSDELASPTPDLMAGLRFLDEYGCTHLTFGNHDWRIHNHLSHPNAIVSYAAGCAWNHILTHLEQRKVKWRGYSSSLKGAFEIGNTLWMHGVAHGLNALQKHLQMASGCNVVHAHTHRAEQLVIPSMRQTFGMSVGLIADPEKLTYAETWPARNSWRHGAVMGYVCQQSKKPESRLWLVSSEPGSVPLFPL